MKTITDGNIVKRMSDEKAAQEVKHGYGWTYCPKKLWKASKATAEKGA